MAEDWKQTLFDILLRAHHWIHWWGKPAHEVPRLCVEMQMSAGLVSKCLTRSLNLSSRPAFVLFMHVTLDGNYYPSFYTFGRLRLHRRCLYSVERGYISVHCTKWIFLQLSYIARTGCMAQFVCYPNSLIFVHCKTAQHLCPVRRRTLANILISRKTSRHMIIWVLPFPIR